MTIVNLKIAVRSPEGMRRGLLVSAQSGNRYRAECSILPDVKRLLRAQTMVLTTTPTLLAQERIASTSDLGRRLFGSFFPERLSEVFFLSLGVAHERRAILRLCLDFPTLTLGSEELAWEYLYWDSRQRFFGLLPEISIVRATGTLARPRPANSQSPLRVLVILNSPTDQPRLNLKGHYDAVVGGLDPLIDEGLLSVKPLENPTKTELIDALRSDNFQVAHFVSHGRFDPRTGEGALFMEDRHRSSDQLSGRDLETLLGACDALRLVVVAACEGALTSNSPSATSLAKRLAEAGVPAVLAMRSSISEQAVLELTPILYGHLSRSGSVDQGLMAARRALSMDGSSEWGVPILFSNLETDQCFKFRGIPGHPWYRELLEIEDLALSGRRGQETAAERICSESWVRRLGERTPRLNELKASLTQHRQGTSQLPETDLRNQVNEFIQELWRAR
ncbi:MAG: CHAT domain-containing protein [bacterium]|nr:CHAT domain-containing protein [bacterium]